MIIAAWVVGILVIAFLFYRSHVRINRLNDSLGHLRDRLDGIASKTEEQISALRGEIRTQTAVPAATPAAAAGASSGNGDKSEVDETLEQKFQEFLDTEINPAVAAHGGFVTLIEVKDRIAYVQLGGGCQGCGMVSVTLKQGIEARMNEVLPEIQELVDTTDHRGGTNPYFQPGKGTPQF